MAKSEPAPQPSEEQDEILAKVLKTIAALKPGEAEKVQNLLKRKLLKKT